ncbi:heptaprenyl diphosphate synthase component II [Bacillus sp. SG-1]|uniref:heptaprenyl diphosphate synthase component II n=1 Tax=Bacillus sp. SG-1 TaxID=161544 RepID=UPI00015450BD|nr:heptaprenyl diphosphate synthase component II [Bacillus sp. SG-1]EDL63178.1 HepT [Bacillus sp. SG-1]
MKYKMIYSFLKADIDLIEKELKTAIDSRSPLLNEASLHLLSAGGKRIRPVFVLLSAKFGDYNINSIKNVAVALELIHSASLVHDDVIDDADLRRGKPTIKSQWDNKTAMYTGDYIFARSLEYMTKIDNEDAHKILSNAIVELTVGEIEQIKDKYRFEQDLKDYLRRIKRKTALLIAVSCQLGAIAAGAPPEIHKKLYRFGYNVGMSFQITDDILDFTASEEELGKPAGSDLLQGNITLPVLFAMEQRDLREKLIKIEEEVDRDYLKAVIEDIKSCGAIEQSHEISARYLKKAMKELEGLPKNGANKTLKDIANFIGKRKF